MYICRQTLWIFIDSSVLCNSNLRVLDCRVHAVFSQKEVGSTGNDNVAINHVLQIGEQ